MVIGNPSLFVILSEALPAVPVPAVGGADREESFMPSLRVNSVRQFDCKAVILRGMFEGFRCDSSPNSA
jgi:hypothetical protein